MTLTYEMTFFFIFKGVAISFISFLPSHPEMEGLPSQVQTDGKTIGKTHVWVSARHGDLCEWGPYSGL